MAKTPPQEPNNTGFALLMFIGLIALIFTIAWNSVK